MNQYNPKIHHRRSIRLKGYDYSQAGLYFITICCQNRACLFGEIVDRKMILNDAGQIANNEWIKTPELRANVELAEFVVMPNHIHGIIRLLGRGELHSPDNAHNDIENDIPIINSGDGFPVIYSGNDISVIYSGDDISVVNGGNDFPIINGGDDISVINGGNDISVINVGNGFPVINSGNDISVINGGDDILVVNSGECNSPLRGASNNIGAIVRGYKSSVTKQLNNLNIGCAVWQRNYYEHIIRNEQSYQTISDYIINNPAKWDDDKFYKK